MTTPIVLSFTSTKGGVGKTTLTANLAALLSDFGLRILMIDADIQPSLSKYYPLNRQAPHGIVELLLGDNSEQNIVSTVSSTVFPNLDIILSNSITADIQTKIDSRIDRAFLLRTKLSHPFFAQNYDVILIDTQGAIGALQNAAMFASDCMITPIMPEVLSAREFLSGTQEVLQRLQQGAVMGLTMPKLRAVIYAQDRTKDAKLIAAQIRDFFSRRLDDHHRLLQTVIPEAKAYKEAATLRIPVHCHERHHAGKSEPAYAVMHSLVYELFPVLQERKLQGDCFGNMTQMLPEHSAFDGVSGAAE